MTHTSRPAANLLRAAACATLVALGAGGCIWPFGKRGGAGASNAVQLQMTGAADQNPDGDGRPQSVQVTVYQLAARARFDAAAPAALLRDDAQALGEDLVEKRVLTLLPAGRESASLPLAKGAKYLAATADFFSRDRDAWRQVVPVPSGGKPVLIDVRGRQLVIR
jgi:type VI secretion system VasD/TssJ family lipoprotein